jgi:hypothetical protein
VRIRSIKPEFWRSDDICKLDWATRLLYIGLWSYVDDNGVGRDSDKLIAADLFPQEEDYLGTLASVRRGLASLADGRQIVRYEVSDRPYFHIVRWSDHQKIDRPTRSPNPLPTSGDASPREVLAEDSPSLRVVVADGSRDLGIKGSRDLGSSGRKQPATRLPEDWSPTDAHRKKASKLGVDIAHEAEQMILWAKSKDERKADWNAAFSGWIGRAHPRPVASGEHEGRRWQE